MHFQNPLRMNTKVSLPLPPPFNVEEKYKLQQNTGEECEYDLSGYFWIHVKVYYLVFKIQMYWYKMVYFFIFQKWISFSSLFICIFFILIIQILRKKQGIKQKIKTVEPIPLDCFN